MALSIAVVIREDPQKSHRPVEALRIALGLSTGGNPLSVVLLGQSPLLLSEASEDIVDADILEKYLPSFKQLEIPFIVPIGTREKFAINPSFDVKEQDNQTIWALVSSSDRVVSF